MLTHSTLGGIGCIVLGSLATIVISDRPAFAVLEISMVLIVFFVSGMSLWEFRREQQKNDRLEYRLKKRILAKIYTVEPKLSQSKALQHYLDKLLIPYPPPRRLKKLLRFCQEPFAIERLLCRFKKYDASQKTLKDLGLSW